MEVCEDEDVRVSAADVAGISKVSSHPLQQSWETTQQVEEKGVDVGSSPLEVAEV